jgi:hypothetical protein
MEPIVYMGLIEVPLYKVGFDNIQHMVMIHSRSLMFISQFIRNWKLFTVMTEDDIVAMLIHQGFN